MVDIRPFLFDLKKFEILRALLSTDDFLIKGDIKNALNCNDSVADYHLGALIKANLIIKEVRGERFPIFYLKPENKEFVKKLVKIYNEAAEL